MTGLHSAFLRRHEVEKLLHLSKGELDRLLEEDADFPRGSEEHVSYFDQVPAREAHWTWDGGQVYVWAARSHRFRGRGAVLLDPTLNTRALAPGKWIGFQPTSHGPAMDWDTHLGVVRLLHTSRRGAARALAEELAEEAGAQGVTTVCSLYGDIGFSGPALIAADTAQPSLEYEVQWGLVTRLVGQPLPWWPSLLRRADVISQWAPGAPVAIADVLPGEQETTLRKAASVWWPDDAAKAALIDMANSMRNRRIDSLNSEIRIFGEHGAHPDGDPLLIAARHRTEGYPLPRIDDRALLAAGWHTIASSQLFEAYEPLNIGRHNEPDLLPFGPETEASTRGAAARRWTRQLTPCAPTALHAVLAGDALHATFYTDSTTGIPVVRKGPSRQATWVFLAPLRLPDQDAQVGSVILEDTVWVRTTNGRIHPGPCTPGDHLWWGPGGGDRPTEAAWVISQLLDDLGTEVTLDEHWRHAPSGLWRLLNQSHKYGAELPRATLEDARAQRADGAP
ncbi:hypothetical protein BSZ07_00285 [Streptomyces sp. M1013]|uniref:hypothetical protein n=1 Tax=Streptomyces sp. M1013 TaxID=549798 RepID=UPI000978D2FD|nr:hypothetical protein [Streptomyces sp. M1013]OMI91380.1 hypothetical protein BSZ07_00285 [Streptomyces sp. M1013]